MAKTIQHRLLAPDGQTLLVLSEQQVRSGETISTFIRRTELDFFDIPTRCFVNGRVIRPSELTKIRIRVRDEIVIVSRPLGGGRSGSPSTAKSIGTIVALVAMAALAPWAGGALAALLPAGATLGGASFSMIFGGLLTAAPASPRRVEQRP